MEHGRTRLVVGVNVVGAVLLSATTYALTGPAVEIDDNFVVSLLLLTVGFVGLYQSETRGMLSYLTKSTGVVLGLWLVGASLDLGAGQPLMWVTVTVGACVSLVHLVLA